MGFLQRFYIQVIFFSFILTCSSAFALAIPTPFEIDSAFDSAKNSSLKQAWQTLTQLQIQAPDSSYFKKVFKDGNLTQYLSDRVHYLIAPKTIISHIFQSETSPPTHQDIEGAGETFAMNEGAGFWLSRVVDEKGAKNLSAQIGAKKIPVLSSRVGIIRIEDIVFTTPLPVILVTLIHEGRHSDCTGGPKLGNEDCLHSHVTCHGGDYDGLDACDAHPWGAYSVGAVFAKSIAENCKNCSRYDREAARAAAIDSLSRYSEADAMLNGKLGDPDMSSATEVAPENLK